jgi:hypothetical protein
MSEGVSKRRKLKLNFRLDSDAQREKIDGHGLSRGLTTRAATQSTATLDSRFFFFFFFPTPIFDGLSVDPPLWAA